MLVFATMAIGINLNDAREKAKSMGPINGHFVSSGILLIAIIAVGFDTNFGELVYSMIVVCLSILFCGALIFGHNFNAVNIDALKSNTLPILGGLSIAWIVLACLLTFSGPFLSTGNGYFAAWAGAITSIFAVNAARKESVETGEQQ